MRSWAQSHTENHEGIKCIINPLEEQCLHAQDSLQMNKNDYGGCQRELGPAVQHLSLAAWTLRSHHTPLSRGEASSVSRCWTGDSETLTAEGHDTKGFSKHQGQISYTCAFKYANRHISHMHIGLLPHNVHLHTSICYIHTHVHLHTDI